MYYRQIVSAAKSREIFFFDVYKRTDQSYARSVHTAYRHKGGQPSFVQKAQKEGVDYVVGMVGEREFVASVCYGDRVERASSHLGAQAARRFFLAFFEYYPCDVGVFDDEADAYAFAVVGEFFHLFFACILETEIYVHRDKFEFFGRESLVCREYRKKSGTVLSSADSDCDPVAVLYH